MSNPKPISLAPLTPEQALRRAMQVPAPASDPKPVKAKRKKKAANKSPSGDDPMEMREFYVEYQRDGQRCIGIVSSTEQPASLQFASEDEFPF